MCLAQGHNVVTPMRLQPAAPRSQVKHSNIDLLRSLFAPAGREKLRLRSAALP